MSEEKKTVYAFDQKDIEENKVVAAIGYLGILCLIPLLTKKDSPFAQAHAKQGVVVAIGWVLWWVPVIGWLLTLPLLVVMAIGIIQALSGKFWEIPVLYDLSKKINL